MTPPEQIYMAYPRHVGKIDALKAIGKAAKFLASSERIQEIEALRTIYRATIAYALSPAGSDPDKKHIPHPATWFNRGSYLDDPSEWQHRNGGFIGQQQTKTDRTLEALAISLGRGAQDATGKAGDPQAGGNHGDGPGGLRGGLGGLLDARPDGGLELIRAATRAR